MTVIALIVAAGTGSRAGLDYPKQYLTLGAKPILTHAIEKFRSHPAIDHVQVIINPKDKDLYEQALGKLQILPWIEGGKTRQASVRNGLLGIEKYAPHKVLIHDAARPFFTHDLIDRCLAALNTKDAVLPAQPMVDTLKVIRDDQVIETLDRRKIVAAQTPQSFTYPSILAAHNKFKDCEVTDDIALAEMAGIPVMWVPGEAINKKLTTVEDIRRITETMLTDIRTGLGFDVHAFADNRELWLGGVNIPFERGLKGHSDADVALHAITDALLGAIGAGDIGTHFPPSEDHWKGASSDIFLAHAGNLITELGGTISNIDLTILCEVPKIGPHRAAMTARIADILGIAASRVSVKATTTEKLGFTGRKEGIAAQAITTIRLPE